MGSGQRAIAEWKAAIIDVAPADFYHHFMYRGGAFAIGNALGWAQLVHNLFRHGRSVIASTISALTATRRLAGACERLPIIDADTIATGARVPFYLRHLPPFQIGIRHGEWEPTGSPSDVRPVPMGATVGGGYR